MANALYVIQILIAVVLIVAILLQAKGSGFSATFTSETTSVFRTRRGIQKTLFQFTIGLTVLFFIVSILSVKLGFPG